jgi:HD-GYP domain-containing protein (c-di-GMP phosphodiesterase class II)
MKTIEKTKSNNFFRCNLAFVIGCIISGLIVALGVAITFYTYDNQKQTALETTEKIFDLSSIQTEKKLKGLIHSVESFVTMTSALQALGAGGEERMNLLLPYFKQSFVTIPWMESFYVGHRDGSFYMIQAIRGNELIRKAHFAPDNTAYSVKMIFPFSDGQQQMQWSYFDSDLVLLETRKVEFDGYDPRERDWYVNAINEEDIIITNPYLFFTIQQIGVTMALSLNEGAGVVGADSVLISLTRHLQKQKLTPSTEIVLLDDKGRVVLSASEVDMVRLHKLHQKDRKGSLHVKDLESQIVNAMFEKGIVNGLEGGMVVEVDGEKWFGHTRKLSGGKASDLYLIIGAPFDELMVNAKSTRQQNLLIMFLVMVVAVVLGLYFSRRIAASLHDLSIQAESVRDFKLTTPFTVQSRICEVNQLADSMTVMQSAINRFVEIARALSAEKQMDKVLEMIVKEAQSVTGADGGGIGLVSDDGKSFSYVLVRNTVSKVHLGDGEIKIAPISLGKAGPREDVVEAAVIRTARTEAFDNIHLSSSSEKYATIKKLHEKDDYECYSLLVIPLLNRQDEVIGLLHLVNAREYEGGKVTGFSSDKTAYVTALASNAALALDNNRLIRAQKELFDSFVRLLAGAIDTKSPYTGGHCQRVPVIAGMLADAATSTSVAPFREFELSIDERYELFVASWLHDCGKVTTPEYVVDKATKLETIYNRIHEIRTRFEVLWRDADIVFLKELIADSAKEQQLLEERDKRRQRLQDDFSYIAECNLGGEFMAPERIIRLQEIGAQTWERYFDKRLGLSGDEEALMDMGSKVTFPVTETLLADRIEHIVPRIDGGDPYGENLWHITMAVPQYQYNHGELYNLSIVKGTLTEEERYKINDHIVQTIDMLNKLPFPKEIRRVPDWAGNHHEKLDGSGYPRSLTAEQLSIPARIMAVADIFEALTAADRPYKKPKKLSTCIKIMSTMRDDGHICPDLFELFLKAGLHREYAEKYMKPEQVDEVNIEEYIENFS